MKLPQDAPQFLQKSAYVIVATRENGIIYHIINGEIQQVDLLEKHLQPLSDDEGFFFGGIGASGGAPKDRNDEEEYAKQLQKQIAHELDQLIKRDDAQVLYIFEPEHLKGRIEAQLQQHNDLSVHTVRYGNFVHEGPHALIRYITAYIDEHKIDLEDHNYKQDWEKYS